MRASRIFILEEYAYSDLARTWRNRGMRVLLLSSTYRPEVRGVATVVEQYLTALAKRGHKVYLVTRQLKGTPSYEEFSNIFVYRFRPSRLSWDSYPLFLLNQFLVARYLIKKVKFNVVHVVTLLSIIPAVFLKLFYGLPLVVSLIGIPTEPLVHRAEPSTSTILQYNIYRVFISLFLRIPNVVIVPSNFAKNFFLGFYGKHLSSKTCIVPRCVNTEEFYPKERADKRGSYPNILHVGGLSYRKGTDILLKAMSQVLKGYPQASLKIIGSGNPSEYVKLADELKIRSAVKFLGEIPHEKIASFFHEADIFVLPSRRFGEVFPNAILEAMASGKPVITTNIGIPTSLVKEGETGLFIEPENHHELAKAIIYLASNKGVQRKMGIKGRRLVEEKYSLKFLANRLERIYLYLTLSASNGAK